MQIVVFSYNGYWNYKEKLFETTPKLKKNRTIATLLYLKIIYR